MIRVFVADDHSFVRRGVRQHLAEVGGFEVVGEAEHGGAVMNSPVLPTCDVLILDLSLPRVSGIEVLQRVRARWPHIAVIVLSMHPTDQFSRRVLQAGAAAYIGKDQPPADLIAAIRQATHKPGASPSPVPAEDKPAPAANPPRHSRLSAREHQVFMLIVSGRTVAEAATELDVHSCTVSNHLAKVREKLGVKTTSDLMRYAWAEGLIDAGPSGTQ